MHLLIIDDKTPWALLYRVRSKIYGEKNKKMKKSKPKCDNTEFVELNDAKMWILC